MSKHHVTVGNTVKTTIRRTNSWAAAKGFCRQICAHYKASRCTVTGSFEEGFAVSHKGQDPFTYVTIEKGA